MHRYYMILHVLYLHNTNSTVKVTCSSLFAFDSSIRPSGRPGSKAATLKSIHWIRHCRMQVVQRQKMWPSALPSSLSRNRAVKSKCLRDWFAKLAWGRCRAHIVCRRWDDTDMRHHEKMYLYNRLSIKIGCWAPNNLQDFGGTPPMDRVNTCELN